MTKSMPRTRGFGSGSGTESDHWGQPNSSGDAENLTVLQQTSADAAAMLKRPLNGAKLFHKIAPSWGEVMAEIRKVIDCRWFPTEKPCNIAISGNEEEVLEVAVQHAIKSHGHQDTPELRETLRSMLREEGKAQAA
jgi:predicted small metal-binding protein